MSGSQDKVTRFAADLVEAAAAEGARSSRSAREQLDHWVRVGRAVSGPTPASRLRVDAVRSGDLPLEALSGPESVTFHAEVAAAIEENLQKTHYGELLAREGVVTVALDADGNLVEHHPDGSLVVLGPL